LQILQVNEGGCWAETKRTAYIATGTPLRMHRPESIQSAVSMAALVGDLPAKPHTLRLCEGDTLVLTRAMLPGKPAPCDAQGNRLGPATIACTLPEVFIDVKAGDRIWLDDGKIGGVIRAVESEQIRVEITQARSGGAKLGADKGINLPDTTIHLPALTLKDEEDLAFIAGHADLIGLSFVREPRDILDLQARLAQLGGERLGIVLKIETRRAFEQLPNLLLAAMRSPCVGVMIARGDLAVECGYERLAELQEEILWICEAAHVPVIWATQVLENLAKEGVPSRAEITDAAMGERAECVMLNKGPHIRSAIRVLDDILQRMQAHLSKKRTMLRHLKLADRFVHAHSLSNGAD
jgi:pyruvate kinase